MNSYVKVKGVMKKYLKIHENDNVAVALTDLYEGETLEVDGNKFILKQNIKRGHKVALKEIDIKENIIKYGSPIGHACSRIDQGELVHTNNVKTNLDGLSEYSYKPDLKSNQHKNRELTFNGYIRMDGAVGIRNELWIVPTVGCVNGIGDKIIESFLKTSGKLHADKVQVIKHNYGCSQLGEDHVNTRTILKNIVLHPNAGGVLVLGLGCENNTIEEFKNSLGSYDGNRVKFLVAQEVTNEIEEGAVLLQQLHENMKKDKREAVDLSNLKVGLKCGGSDGLSGITANPLLGMFSDFLIAQGGTSILTEVPEMFGSEKLLINRAKDEQVFNKIVTMINDFKDYFIEYNQPIYENPSPGNRAGGITTLEDKSLGCTQKSGTETVMDVLMYGDVIKTSGLNLLSAPGNDLVAATALGAAGCQLVLFTTGRGTPFGSFTPTMKISTNSALYEFKKHWIDFDAGVLLQNISMEELLEDFIKYIISVASGVTVNNEINHFSEIAIFKNGVTL